MIDVNEIRSTFKQLNAKIQDIKINNRKLVEVVAGKQEVHEVDAREGHRHDDKDNARYVTSDAEMIKLLQKPLYEFSDFKSSNNSQSRDNLAKLTYNKELKGFENYKRTRTVHKGSELSNVVEYMKAVSEKRYKIGKKKRMQGLREGKLVEGFINEKNRRFNAKIQRKEKRRNKHYRKNSNHH